MSRLVGADPEALQGLSDTLRSKADRLTQMQESTSASVISLAWEGAVAEDFLTVWSFAHGPKFAEAAAFLIQAAETLTRNATEQRTASAAESGSVNTSSGALQQSIRDRLLSVGFLLDSAEMSMLIRLGNPELVDWLVDHASLFNSLRTVATGGSVIHDFLNDAVQHGSLPTDERIVHAIGEATMKYAADKGISHAMQWGGAALVAAFTAGVGALLGKAGGWLVGEGLAAIFRYFDEQSGWTDKGADVLTEMYRNVRDNPDPYLRAIPFAGPAIVGAPKAWGSVTNLVPDIGSPHSNPVGEDSAVPDQIASTLDALIDDTAELVRTAPSPHTPRVPQASTW